MTTSPPQDRTAGRGAPVVLLHGATSSPRAWAPVLPMLGARYEVWAPCLAGHRGGSPLSVPPSQLLNGIVETLIGELDERAITTAHLVGNSLGGWVALELARRGRAASVLALSPAGAWRSPKDLARLLAGLRITAATRNSRLTRALIERPATRRIVWRAIAEHYDRVTVDAALAHLDDQVGCTALTDLVAGVRSVGPITAFEKIDIPGSYRLEPTRSAADVPAIRAAAPGSRAGCRGHDPAGGRAYPDGR